VPKKVSALVVVRASEPLRPLATTVTFGMGLPELVRVQQQRGDPAERQRRQTGHQDEVDGRTVGG